MCLRSRVWAAVLDLGGGDSGRGYVGGYDGEVMVLTLEMVVCERWR